MASNDDHPLQLQILDGDREAFKKSLYYQDFNNSGFQVHYYFGNQCFSLLDQDTMNHKLANTHLQNEEDSSEEDSDDEIFETKASAFKGMHVSKDNNNAEEEKKKKVDQKYPYDPVIEAVRMRHLRRLKWLIKNGVNVNVEHSGESALCVAVSTQLPKCTRLLIKAGADVNHVSYTFEKNPEKGISVLMKAIMRDRQGYYIDLLLKSGVDLNWKTCRGLTALHSAIHWKNYTAFRKLVEAGIELNNSYVDLDNSPLTLISGWIQRNPNTWKTLRDNQFYKNCFHLLVEAGADLDKQDYNGNTALMYVAETNQVECVQLLIKAGANVNTTNHDGRTALMNAVEYLGPSSHYLRSASYSPYIDIDYENLLKRSCRCANSLIRAGADVNMMSNNQNTALLSAWMQDNLLCVKLLLANGAVCYRLENTEELVGPLFLRAFGSALSTKIQWIMRATGNDFGDNLMDEIEVTLMRLCRQKIRNHLLELDEYTSLFHRVPLLPLPSLLQKYLLYYQDLGYEYMETFYWSSYIQSLY